ncbi:MAG TPA: hypothetical protein VN768_05270, partial [Acidimicrobiales bacterium]|nr:hypothetical protein [Acidimicrobiales bacterium]
AHAVEVGHFYNIVAATHDPAMGLNPYQEIQFTGLYAVLGAHGAKLLSFFDLVLVLLGVVAFARRHLASTRVGIFAALAVLSIPVVSWAGTTAYNDLPVALYTLLAAHALAVWWRDRGSWTWAYVGIGMAAFSLGVKDLGLFTLALAVVVVVLGIVRRPELRVHFGGRAVRIVATASVVCLPWWIRAGAMTGNPIFPLANNLFRSQYWNSYAASAGAAGNRHVSIVHMPFDLVGYLWTTVSQPSTFHTIVGPFFLLGLPIAGVLVLCTTDRPPPLVSALALGVLAWTAGWYLSALSDSRYLTGIAPLACLVVVAVIAEALKRPRLGRLVPLTAAVVMVAAVISTSQPVLPLQRGAADTNAELGTVGLQWDYLYRHEPEVDVQLRWLPMAQYVNAHLPALRTKIFDAASLSGYYMYVLPELFDGWSYGSPATMHQWSLKSPNVLAEFRRNGITDVVVRASVVRKLRRETVWPHLHLTYDSPDGLVLYHVVG